MSRIALTPKNPEHEVIIGLDHAIGWFCQLFAGKDENGEDIVLIDKSSKFNPGFKQMELIEFIKEYAIQDREAIHCISQILFDLDPAEA